MTEASLLSQHVPSIGITAFFLLLLIPSSPAASPSSRFRFRDAVGIATPPTPDGGGDSDKKRVALSALSRLPASDDISSCVIEREADV